MVIRAMPLVQAFCKCPHDWGCLSLQDRKNFQKIKIGLDKNKYRDNIRIKMLALKKNEC